MNRELAKRLKDAGFPLIHSSTQRSWMQLPGLDYDEPLLSELIEACGEGFDYLVHTHGTRKDGWYAEAGLVHQGGGIDGERIVDSPETAVANLWLALNTKP